MRVYIYALRDPETLSIRYVGKTVDPKLRLRKHCTRKENNYKFSWVTSLRERGLKPEMVILEELEVERDEEWQPYEQKWILFMRSLGFCLTNLNSGGVGGARPCEETRKKMSESHLNVRCTPETRAKISAAHKGVPKSESTRRKFSERMKGWRPSDETRKKMSENARRLMTPERIAIMKASSKTPEALAKMSMALTGRTQSAETISKRLKSRGKIVHTDESKAKLSAKAKERLTPERVRYLTLCRTNPEAAKAMRASCGFGSTEPVVHWP